ncbi:MAG: hypothetical protein K5683_03455 [Prevotella sp.]|nr:hypothetical protein [Prevotella sp.]
MRRKTLPLLISCLAAGTAFAQQTDSTAFRGRLENKEYNVYMNIDFYDNDVEILGQDIYGKLPGYLSTTTSTFCWIVLSAELKGSKAEMEMVNDYGSEDLTATLIQENDSTFTLLQGKGSTIKVPKANRWQKLPSKLTLIKRKKGK